MMTSVTLPSTSGPLNGGYSSSVTEGISASETSFDVPRTIKRSLGVAGSESCKKRRKQSTPIRISNTESESSPASNSLEGKPTMPSPEPNLRCPVCQVRFEDSEQVQNHIICEHPPLECKKEPEDQPTTPTSLPFLDASESVGFPLIRTEMQWMNDMQSKEWINSSMPNLPFNATNPLFMSLPQFAQPENIPMKSIRIFNPDAFCELCNKEFCNKYFLKTHKANKHGIYTDSISSESLQAPVTVPALSNSIKLPNIVPTVESATTKGEIKNPTKPIHPFTNMFLSKQTGVNLSEGELSENVATSNGLSSSSDSDKHYLDDQAAEYPSPSNTQTETTSIKNEPDELFHDTSSKLSTDQQSRELDLSYRLRRFGVMNPKAFCEICCKEYCNKYFLRTHKLKRHGIYIPDDKEKDCRPDGASNFSLPTNVQTSPLNLIMTEQSNNSDCKTTSPTNISCDTCGIKFQNASLAQLHNVSVHNKLGPKEQDDMERCPQDITRLPEMLKAEKSLNAEAINEDLQKLQTMILQLNELDTTKTATACNVCNKEFDNRFYLHAHMLSVHGMLLDGTGEVEKATEPENTSNNNTMCDLCGKEVKNADEMTKHIIEFHSSNPIGCDSNKEESNSGDKITNNRVPTSSGHIPERRVSMNVTPTSSYCEICNKELCNKYFMKTHMQRMHGIEIENGAQIGGVVCDICNKELCSKYFLRVHKHNTHGIMEYGSNLFPPRKPDSEAPPPPPQSFAPPPDPDPALKPGDLADLSHRYFTHFTEVCTICSRRFRSTKWLKAHLVTDHGQAGAEKWNEIEQQLQNRNSCSKGLPSMNSEGTSPNLRIPNGGQEQKEGVQHFISNIFGIDENNSRMYQCSSCSFTTPLLPLLFVHERSHTTDLDRLKCPVCPQTFVERELLQRHLLSQHPFVLPSVFKDKESGSIAEGSKCTSEDGDNDQVLDTNEQSTASTGHPESGDQDSDKGRRSSSPMKVKPVELSSEIGQSLKDVAKRMQWPATYAIPQSGSRTLDQDQEETTFTSRPGYVMQAFLLEESTSERRVMPSVVFLPMLQKQPAPITITFTLTPA